MAAHRESPVKRVNPSGQVVWKGRYTDRDGRRRSAGTFKLRREAQDAIDAAYDERPRAPETVAAYLDVWLRRYPRSPRTNKTNEGRIRAVLALRLDGRLVADWPLRELRRRHALELVDLMLRDQRRAPTGAQGILRSLSAMAEDAITDELCDVNAFKGVRVRGTDIRAVKAPTPVRVFTFEDMHRLAGAAGRHEAMIRTLCDCGLRIGELFALRRSGLVGDTLQVSGSAWEGAVNQGSREKNHDRLVPVPSSLLLLLRSLPPRIDSELLFPTARGRLWRYSNFRRQVWNPAQRATGLDIRPHEARHSYISVLAANGVDEADLAAITGHGVQTLVGRYRHPLERSFEQVRGLVG